MKSNKNNNSIHWLFYLSLIFIFSACYEPTDGCLDVAATNFDVTADNDCCSTTEDCCCNYPSLNLAISHKVGEGNLVLGDSATYDSIQYFKIIDAKIYLSDFGLIQSDGTRFGVTDTISIYQLQGLDTVSCVVEDNFILVDRNSSNPFSFNLGGFINAGPVDSLRFLIGLEDKNNLAIPEKMPSDHPLAIQNDSMYWDSSRGYIFSKIRLVKNIAQGDTTTYEIGLPTEPISVGLPYFQTIEFGFDITIPIEINYANWFQGINFAVDSDEEIQTKIVNNLSKAFQITE